MVTIQYKEWQVEYYGELPVTVNTYFKHNITINKADGKYVMTVYKQELCLSDAKGLLSGDETLAQKALDSVIYNRKYELNILERFNNNKITFKH